MRPLALDLVHPPIHALHHTRTHRQSGTQELQAQALLGGRPPESSIDRSIDRSISIGEMIKFILFVNKQGQTRLSTYYTWMTIPERVALEAEIIRKCLSRSELQCSFTEHRGYKVSQSLSLSLEPAGAAAAAAL